MLKWEPKIEITLKIKIMKIFSQFSKKKKNIKKFLFKIFMFLLLQIFIIETVHWTTAERYG